ncbi:MAG TPA: hypothetical protein VNY05_38555 [Candidatus Acidoferrales bacterium]|jgi:hypothetical protein|nr:hypothetical protein [Candidatus Acidoferrales bacterium]
MTPNEEISQLRAALAALEQRVATLEAYHRQFQEATERARQILAASFAEDGSFRAE